MTITDARCEEMKMSIQLQLGSIGQTLQHARYSQNTNWDQVEELEDLLHQLKTLESQISLKCQL